MKILFLGDFFYDYNYKASDLKELIDYIKENEYSVVLNMETALFDANKPIKKRGPNLKSSETIVELLKEMNCICVCLSNNHAMDYGEDSLKKTISILTEEGIGCIGAGENIEQALVPYIIEDCGKKVILNNFGWDVEETVYATKNTAGCAPLDKTKILEIIKGERKDFEDSIIINIFHWGFEYNTLPMPIDIKFAHECIEAGANAIIGHHPHVLQPYEEYLGSPIYYSLGNFYFGSRRDGFPMICKSNRKGSLCDYGIGVIYDAVTQKTDVLKFFYNREKQETELLDDNGNDIVGDIRQYDWMDKKYIDEVREHAYKNNPILGLDDKQNKRAIRLLYIKYAVAGKIQFLKKSKIGTDLYNFLKKI